MNEATTQLAGRARDLLDDGFTLYLASRGGVLESLDTVPLELPITTIDLLAGGAHRRHFDELMLVYNRLNAVAFGPAGIPLPRWVMVDLGLLPTAFLLIALPRTRVRDLARDPDCRPRSREILQALLEEAAALGYDGPVPVAGYCASPAASDGDWVGWSLCSALSGRRLGTTAKAVALCVYRPRRLIGVTQYGNPSLAIHRRFGPMRLLAATLPLHTAPGSLVYETDLQAADDPPHGDATQATVHVGPDDGDRHRELQELLDAGTHELSILPPGVDPDGHTPVLARPLR